MGLKNNEKYTATKHFRDRLLERYGVVDSQWKQYMRKMYGSLQLDEQKTANQHAFYQRVKKRVNIRIWQYIILTFITVMWLLTPKASN